MLKHETEQMPTAQIPAAQRRVSAEELTRAVSALEDAKTAEQVAGVAPIGQVVDELGLDSTPEEIWAEVQKQRAQKAAAEQAKQKPPEAAASGGSFVHPIFSHLRSGHFLLTSLKRSQARRRMRRGMGGWIWVLFWCTGGFGLVTGLPHLLHSGVGQVETIGGDSTVETVSAQGKNIIILGDGDKITLTGQARSVINLGEGTTLRGESPKTYESLGDHSDVQWTNPVPPQISDKPHTTQIETKQAETKPAHAAGTP